MNPKRLYHGSSYLHEELKPGFHHTEQLVEWDQVESNQFLYASTVEKDAFDQAFASWLERKFEIKHYQSHNGHITVTLKDDKIPTAHELAELKVYVYTIDVQPEDFWVKNNNPHNNISTEWKTQNVIPAGHIVKVNTFDTTHLNHILTFKQDLGDPSVGMEAITDFSVWQFRLDFNRS